MSRKESIYENETPHSNRHLFFVEKYNSTQSNGKSKQENRSKHFNPVSIQLRKNSRVNLYE